MTPVRATAELLWTSALTFDGMGEHNREFCSLLNTAIRDDHPKLAYPTAMLLRGLNAMCCAGRGGGVLPFPSRGVTYRGGGFDDSYRGFFTKGKQYRQPGFLATSFSEAKAQEFLEKAVTYGRQPILWVVHVDPAGEHVTTQRCNHVNFVLHSVIDNPHGPPDPDTSVEKEYLFTAYSIFTIRSVTWGEGGAAHRIELDAATDNRVEAEGGDGPWATPVGSEGLPLAPWS